MFSYFNNNYFFNHIKNCININIIITKYIFIIWVLYIYYNDIKLWYQKHKNYLYDIFSLKEKSNNNTINSNIIKNYFRKQEYRLLIINKVMTLRYRIIILINLLQRQDHHNINVSAIKKEIKKMKKKRKKLLNILRLM